MKYLPIVLCLFVSCDVRDEDQAEIGRYYYSLETKNELPAGAELFDQVFEGITDVDYYLTEESAAKGWPFYGEVSRNKKILKSELMPPHTWVHRLIPMSEFPEAPEEKHIFKSEFIVYQFSDTIIEIGAVNYEYENGKWKRPITTAKAELNPNDFDQESELAAMIRKTLIRDTFK